MNTRETIAYRIRQLCKEQGLTPIAIQIMIKIRNSQLCKTIRGNLPA